MTNKTILITGAAGFMGSRFVAYLYEKYPDYKLIVLDALTYAGHIENLPVNINENPSGRLTFWYGNIRNAELVDELISKSDIVVHFAAETHVTRSIFDNYAFFETNVMGTHVITNSVLNHKDKIERFIHISSSEVYGTSRTEFMDEEHPLMPMSPYASAKAGADRLVYSYWATYDIPLIIVRPFNNYGPGQHLEKAIPRFITSCILNEKLRVHGDGSAARDFVFIQDTCRALDALMHADINKVKGEAFNIASGTARTILSIAKDVVRMMGKDESLITLVGDRPGQVFRHCGATSKIEKTIGWRPEISWEEGLNLTKKWYESNGTWWKKHLWMRAIPIITADGKIELH